MKKILYILCAMVAFASCQKEELPTENGQNPDGSYTFNIGIEEPDYTPKTRGTVTMARYMLEMYEGDLTATPVKLENTNGVFNVKLKKGVDYVCLFWADNGTSYTVSDLKAVKQTDETALGTAAYCTSVTVNSKTFNGTITLKRAVAELSFIDKNGLNEATNTLWITYPYASTTLNVGEGTVAYSAGTLVRTIADITPPEDKADAFTTDFVLAPTVAGKLTGLKFKLNSEEEKTIAETAVQANYRTKITGEYQPKPLPPAAVGDYFYKDGTYSSTYTTDAANPCIGIVFYVNADGKSGKIVSLDEGIGRWGVYPYEESNNGVEGIRDENDGATATKNLITARKGNANFATDYYAFNWIYVTKNGSDVNGSWYLPAINEFAALHDAWNSNRTAFNKALTDAGGVGIFEDWYWSSTERNFNFAWVFFFGDITYDDGKGNVKKVRGVLAF